MNPLDVIPADRLPLVEAYARALEGANEAVNLVSRASVDRIRSFHVEHSLTLALKRFEAGSIVVDWGTGGGLPAVPLAICFPDVEFVAVDSIAKKCRALRAILADVGLENVSVWNGRAEEWDGVAQYAVSRATAPLDRLWHWTRRVLRPVDAGDDRWDSGLLCLKGGDLEPERRKLRGRDRDAETAVVDLAATFGRSDWADKYIVHVTPGRGARS